MLLPATSVLRSMEGAGRGARGARHNVWGVGHNAWGKKMLSEEVHLPVSLVEILQGHCITDALARQLECVI